jgi:hypothetical protein
MRPSRSAFFATMFLLLSPIAFIPSASAAMEYNLRISFPEGEGFTSCTGEEVFVTGEQHIVGQVTIDAAGQEHFVFHRNNHGTGVGTVSGAEYVLIDTVAKVDLVGTHDGDNIVFNQFHQELLIRKGETAPDDDNVLQIMTRYTMTPDGTLTGEIDIISQECR